MTTYGDEMNCQYCNKIGELFCCKCKISICNEKQCFSKHNLNCKDYLLKPFTDYFNEQKPITTYKMEELESIRKNTFELLSKHCITYKNSRISLAYYKRDIEREYKNSINLIQQKESLINQTFFFQKLKIMSFLQEIKLLRKSISHAKIWNDSINERFQNINFKFDQIKYNFLDFTEENSFIFRNKKATFQEKEIQTIFEQNQEINKEKVEDKDKEKLNIKSELSFLKSSVELILEKLNIGESSNLLNELNHRFNNSQANLVSYLKFVEEILTKNHKNQKSLKIVYNFKNRIKNFPKHFIFYLFEDSKGIFLNLIKFADDKFIKFQIYNTILANNSTVAIEETSDSIIITGGYFNKKFLDCGIRILDNINGCSFKEITRMNYRRCRHRLLTMHNLQYCLGGYNEDKALAECEFFNELTNKWNIFPSFSSPTCDLTVIGIENRYIYAFSSLINSSIFKIDIFRINKAWQDIPYTSIRLVQYGICIPKTKDKILILGGKSNQGNIFELDLNTFQLVEREEIFNISKDGEYWFSCVKNRNENFYAVFVKSKSIIKYNKQNDRFGETELYF